MVSLDGEEPWCGCCQRFPDGDYVIERWAQLPRPEEPWVDPDLDEPRTTDYCLRCGESPDSGSHLPHGHPYEDPRVQLDHLVAATNEILLAGYRLQEETIRKFMHDTGLGPDDVELVGTWDGDRMTWYPRRRDRWPVIKETTDG